MYNTNSDADDYFNARFGFEKWGLLTEPNKSKALFSANQILDNICEWFYDKTDSEQTAEFPRNGEIEIPTKIKYAECEIAYLIVENNSVVTDPGAQLIEMKAGPVSMKFDTVKQSNPLINDLIKIMVSDFGELKQEMSKTSTTIIDFYRG